MENISKLDKNEIFDHFVRSRMRESDLLTQQDFRCKILRFTKIISSVGNAKRCFMICLFETAAGYRSYGGT